MSFKLNNSKKTKVSTKKQPANSTEEESSLTVRLSKLGLTQKSPSNQELIICNNRIISVLNEVIVKSKIVLSFKLMFANNNCLLRKYLPEEQFDFVKTITSIFINEESPPRLQSLSKQGPYTLLGKSSTNFEKHRAHSFLSQTIEFIWINKEFKKTLLELFESKIGDPMLVNFINTLKKFTEVVQQKINQSAEETERRELNLKILWKKREELDTEMNYATEILKQQRKRFTNELKSKIDEKLSCLSGIKQFDDELYENALEIQKKSQTEMQAQSQDSSVYLDELTEETKNMQQQYENLLGADLRVEKSLRAKRSKIETQLIGWLGKYDSDMTSRQEELDELQEMYDQEMIEFEKLKMLFNDQEEEYVYLMEEKRIREYAIWRIKAENFRSNHAARICQKSYKAYRLYKLSKRKSRGKTK